MTSRNARMWKAAVVVGLVVVGVAWADGVRLFAPDAPALADDVNHNFAVVAPTGTIVAWAGRGTTPPDGWLFCDGAAFNAATYPALQAVLLATTVPDLRGRVVLGLDPTSMRVSGALADVVGDTGGADVTTQVPAHTHPITADGAHSHLMKATCNGGSCNDGNDGFARAAGGSVDIGSFSTPGTAGQHSHGGATGSTGAASVTNLPPFMALRYIIKT